KLSLLPHPMHGKPSVVRVLGGTLFQGLKESFVAGGYHSLYARLDSVPGDLLVTADTADGVVMGIEHRSLPIAAVQFHPESIMTLQDRVGHRLLENLLRSF